MEEEKGWVESRMGRRERLGRKQEWKRRKAAQKVGREEWKGWVSHERIKAGKKVGREEEKTDFASYRSRYTLSKTSPIWKDESWSAGCE